MIAHPQTEDVNRDRRRLISAAAMAITAAQFGMASSSNAQPAKRERVSAIKPGTHTSFASIKQITADELNVGYAESGPADGPAVILLHGWPYDIYSYADVSALLASAGYRVIVPYLRGYGSTSFLSEQTFRNGQPSVVALDIIHLMDELKIQTAVLGGFDWGARTADIIAALWPKRCKSLVSVSGYLIGSPAAERCRCHRRPSWSGGTNSISRRSGVRSVTTNIGMISPSSSGNSPRRNGSSATQRSTAVRRPSTIRITSPL